MFFTTRNPMMLGGQNARKRFGKFLIYLGIALMVLGAAALATSHVEERHKKESSK